MKKLLPFLLFIPCFAAPLPEGFLSETSPPKLNVENRILTVVNGKPITVVDVMKRMEMDFFQNYPEYASEDGARMQFFQVNWRRTLQELIDKELILADALENNMPLEKGDVRQEMETLFGPNLRSNLEKLGVSYDEAFETVKGDILIRRMIFFRVNAKAIRDVTPQVIRDAYKEYAAANIRPKKWTYQVVSIRHPEPIAGEKLATLTSELLKKQVVTLDTLKETLDGYKEQDKELKITISDEYSHTENEISPAYLDALKTLSADTYSEAISQKSRRDQSMVYRIFYLKDFEEAKAPGFKEVENEIKTALMEKIVDEETKVYLKGLKQHYALHESDLKELTNEGYQPFIIN